MKSGTIDQGIFPKEAVTAQGSYLPLSQWARDSLATAIAVGALLAAQWWIWASLISGLEDRLTDRMDALHRDISSQIGGLEDDMAEGFRQTHQRMDRMDGRMGRIESHIDAIEEHLYRIGEAIENETA